MKLSITFSIKVNVMRPKQNYTGAVTLFPRGKYPKTFYFIILNFYDGKEAEFMIFEDEEKRRIFAEGIGTPELKQSPRADLPMTHFDFSINEKHRKAGTLYVVTQIIAEGVFQVEMSKQGNATVTSSWEHNFEGARVHIARNFQDFFGIPF